MKSSHFLKFNMYIFITGLYSASLAIYLVGKYSIAMVMTSVYVYTAELYPTKYRHSLFAFSSMMGRIGSIIAPLTPAFVRRLYYYLILFFLELSFLLNDIERQKKRRKFGI